MKQLMLVVPVVFGLALTMLLLNALDQPETTPAAHAAASELAVCPTAGPNCDYTVIQEAVDAAGEGDVIKIAAGTYTQVNAYGGLAQVVYISKSLTLQGGYTSDFVDPPDPEVNITTLDAEGNGRVLYSTGEISVALYGLRITGGDARPYEYWDGGGVYLHNASSVVRYCRFDSNAAGRGGGSFVDGGDAEFDGVVFMNNVTTGEGGGGLYLGVSDTQIKDSEFVSNTTQGHGGGIFSGFSNLTLIGNTIMSNSTQYAGAGDGGGVFVNVCEDLNVRDNVIASNSALRDGGGIVLNGCDGVVANNAIQNNLAFSDGGGVAIVHSSPVFDGNSVVGNVAGEDGGGIFSNYVSRPAIWSSFILSNTSQNGGGIYLDTMASAILRNNVVAGNQISGEGAGIYIFDAFPKIINTTFAQNTGGDNAAVFVSSDYPSGPYSQVWITNTIIVSHTVGVYVDDVENTFVNLEATLWGNDSDWSGDGTIYTGTVNVWGGADFVDPAAGDYHIDPDSAAKDVGVDSGVGSDIDGEPRPYNGAFDIGADEYWPPGALKKVYLPLIIR